MVLYDVQGHCPTHLVTKPMMQMGNAFCCPVVWSAPPGACAHDAPARKVEAVSVQPPIGVATALTRPTWANQLGGGSIKG